MRNTIFWALLFAVVAAKAHTAQGQTSGENEGRKNFSFWTSKTPVEAMNAVAGNVIRNTPFRYKLEVEKLSENFDFIKFVDFGRTFGTHKHAIAYALSEISAVKDTTIVLEVSHNDGLMVWVNNKEVYKSEQEQEFHSEARERDIKLMNSFTVALKKGRNKILLKSETKQKKWLVFLQPQNATIEFSPVKGLTLGISRMEGVEYSVSSLSNWLVCGPFDAQQGGFAKNYGPEEGLIIGKTYPNQAGETSWTIPKTEIFTNVLRPHPLWGTLYNYNYHTAGLAWAMANFGKTTQRKEYIDYAIRYCDFMLDARKMVDYQYNQLHGFRSVQHHLINTPLLDFTAAPTLPYAWFIAHQPDAKNIDAYKARVEEIKAYLKTGQVRLPDGTFTRETPEKYTTWVDDMFMGIPFLVHAGLASNKPEERSDYLQQAAQQVIGFNKQVFDPKDHLYHHATYSGRKAFIPYWSRANGWGIFATTVVLQNLPSSHPMYKDILKAYRLHCKKLVALQDAKTGFWHQILNDTSAYLETSGTAIFTMALARGLNEGWIKGAEYQNAANKGWQAIASQINEQGDVYNICIGTMSSENPEYYKTRPLVKSDSHGLIGVFWAAMEMQKLRDNQKK